jgi:hypothetical protein
MRAVVDDAFERGQLAHGVTAAGILVETLLERDGDGDVREAEAATERLVVAGVDGLVLVDVIVLRLRALLARAGGDEAAFGDLVSRYRAKASALGYEGHVAMADALTVSPARPAGSPAQPSQRCGRRFPIRHPRAGPPSRTT